ncbi:MAG: helix-turn-helix transcriptional regulator [Butyrivibrio sp.]|nr:helix-turn-helix transcriptional regulator [Butyrivibrio sp.]
MQISERIFKILNEKNMNLAEFSRKTGISHSTVSDWRRKKTNPSADKILTICDVLGVNPYELLQDNDGDNNKSLDYMILSEGTDKYRLVIEFDGLSPDKKERLFGYLNALKDLD